MRSTLGLFKHYCPLIRDECIEDKCAWYYRSEDGDVCSITEIASDLAGLWCHFTEHR